MKLMIRVIRWTLALFALFTAVAYSIDWLLTRLHAPWWTHLVAGFLIGGVIGGLLPLWVRRTIRREVAAEITPTHMWVDRSENPMDPHGDGSLRPGDAMYDNYMLPMMRGQLPDGVWVVRHPEGIFEIYGSKNEQGIADGEQ